MRRSEEARVRERTVEYVLAPRLKQPREQPTAGRLYGELDALIV